MFVESFQGQYKDGTNGSHNFRMVSASFLILRILTMATYFLDQPSGISSGLQYVLFTVSFCVYAIIRPYKLNNVDFLILVLMEKMSFELFAGTYHIAPSDFTYYIKATILLLGVPHMVLIFYACYVLAKKASITHCLKRKLRRYMQVIRLTAEPDHNSLPDRLINPGEYEPVLPTTEKHSAAETTDTDNKEPDNENPRRLTPVYTYGSIS